MGPRKNQTSLSLLDFQAQYVTVEQEHDSYSTGRDRDAVMPPRGGRDSGNRDRDGFGDRGYRGDRGEDNKDADDAIDWRSSKKLIAPARDNASRDFGRDMGNRDGEKEAEANSWRTAGPARPQAPAANAGASIPRANVFRGDADDAENWRTARPAAQSSQGAPEARSFGTSRASTGVRSGLGSNNVSAAPSNANAAGKYVPPHQRRSGADDAELPKMQSADVQRREAPPLGNNTAMGASGSRLITATASTTKSTPSTVSCASTPSAEATGDGAQTENAPTGKPAPYRPKGVVPSAAMVKAEKEKQAELEAAKEKEMRERKAAERREARLAEVEAQRIKDLMVSADPDSMKNLELSIVDALSNNSSQGDSIQKLLGENHSGSIVPLFMASKTFICSLLKLRHTDGAPNEYENDSDLLKKASELTDRFKPVYDAIILNCEDLDRPELRFLYENQRVFSELGLPRLSPNWSLVELTWYCFLKCGVVCEKSFREWNNPEMEECFEKIPGWVKVKAQAAGWLTWLTTDSFVESDDGSEPEGDEDQDDEDDEE